MWPFKKKQAEEKPAAPTLENTESIEVLDIPFVVYRTTMKSGVVHQRRVSGSYDLARGGNWDLIATYPNHILWHPSFHRVSNWVKVSESPETFVKEEDIAAVETKEEGTVRTAFQTTRYGRMLLSIKPAGEVIDGLDDN